MAATFPILSWVHGLHFNNIRGDLYGGLVAAVVALPLALAFGVTSGLGAIAGLLWGYLCGVFRSALRRDACTGLRTDRSDDRGNGRHHLELCR